MSLKSFRIHILEISEIRQTFFKNILSIYMCTLTVLPNKIGILVYKYIYLISIYGFQKFLAGRLPDIVRFFTCFFGFGVLYVGCCTVNY